LVLSDHVGVMNQGRFEQLATPQDLYYRPQTPFVASFVGANNRIVGRCSSSDGRIAEIETSDGWRIRASMHGSIGVGDAVEAFVRPEIATLARSAAELPAAHPHHGGEVQSVLFDGANSAVLVQERATRREFRIALPQTGQFSDLKPRDAIAFSFDPARAACFPARAGSAGQDA
jgi:spermidine/putrescine transport system ATP-binding protein